ncbi:MAG TPA: AfsR/SARP family transcriptional regulator, partial [Actinomycetota bacterium]|nr:AfsR/SARP family transcriptional regulator [Actinomycetota bacterium]
HDQALRAALATRDRPVVAQVAGLAAAIALAGGDPGRAAELLGMAETLRGMPDEADLDLRRITGAARAALGDPAFDRAYRRGAARPREEVLAALTAEVSSAAGTPAGPAGPPPPR